MRTFFAAAFCLASLGACSAASTTTPASRPVAPAPPPKDDGHSAQGGAGGDEHSAALEQLRTAPIKVKGDKQASVLVPLPDGDHWTRVRFLTVPSLVGFRYGKEHHAIVAGFVTHVDDNAAPGACNKSFEGWAMPYIEAFEVELKHEAPEAFPWSAPQVDKKAAKSISIVDIDAVTAKTATVLSRESYEAAWSAYPAWPKACLIVGVAVPSRDDPQRAKDVRDRFAKEVLPKIVATSVTEPKEAY